MWPAASSIWATLFQSICAPFWGIIIPLTVDRSIFLCSTYSQALQETKVPPENLPQTTGSVPETAKEAYTPPTVSSYGTLRDITLAVGAMGALDGGMFPTFETSA
jgi:hypothetical protein